LIADEIEAYGLAGDEATEEIEKWYAAEDEASALRAEIERLEAREDTWKKHSNKLSGEKLNISNNYRASMCDAARFQARADAAGAKIERLEETLAGVVYAKNGLRRDVEAAEAKIEKLKKEAAKQGGCDA